ncbi:MAG: DNA polymerase III subunit chi [Rhodobacterales bacterium]|nr:MAG: DNA polymerase III subunit chi [Rhodobacterales bacterium]
MGAVFFYHLTRNPLERTLPMLLGKSRERGWSVVVRGTDRARLAQLDEALWLGPEEAFLPHGMAGGPHDALQPVLLTDAPDAPNGAQCLMAIDGAGIDVGEVDGFERACLIFDGNDQSAVAAARVQWKTLVDAGCSAQYWSEESGRWQKKAESGG